MGVDIQPMPNYPYEFVQADALEFLRDHGDEFDARHAGPPCQRNSSMTKRWGSERVQSHPDLIAPTRELLVEVGGPWVIENVVGAPLIQPVMLCGGMFDLGTDYDGEHFTLRRHRLFETNWNLTAPAHPKHEGRAVGVYGHPGGSSKRDGIRFPQFSGWKGAMGVDWMTVAELAESIPPAYTRWIGLQLLADTIG